MSNSNSHPYYESFHRMYVFAFRISKKQKDANQVSSPQLQQESMLVTDNNIHNATLTGQYNRINSKGNNKSIEDQRADCSILTIITTTHLILEITRKVRATVCQINDFRQHLYINCE